MKEIRQLAGQTVIYGLGTIVPRFLNYGILTFMYTRIFPKEEYGIITELYAWMVLFQIILTYGMETGFFRFSQNQDEYKKVYSTTLISLLITSSLFLILTNVFIKPFSEFLKYENNREYIRMFTAILAIDAFSAIPFARLRRHNKAKTFSIIKILNVVITIVVVIFFLVIAPHINSGSKQLPGWLYNPGFGVGYVFLANLAGSLCTMLMLLPWIIDIKPEFDREILKKMLGYSLPLLVAGLAGSINDAIDKLMLRRIIGEENGLYTVGEYGAGYKIGVLMALFVQMFRFAAEPFFFERAGKADAKKTYAEVMKYFIIAMLIVFLGLNLYKSGIQYILGRDYRNSLVVVPMISMAYLLYGIYMNHSIWYKINNLTRYGIYITLMGAAVTIAINALFIPAYGYMASAWAHVFSYLTMIIASFIFASKHYKVEYQISRLIPYFIMAILMVAFAELFQYKTIVSEIAVNTVFLIVFIAFAQYKDKLISKILNR
ncbi:MAG TPA: oligosaccharide flippase family protein [Bacteroidales bacterium]|nr:oligosaccharide flippase family protein [Bacteroidales bacterium]HRT88514.1 oligosaccharide flippase family protein [Bacteroidales bacterium]